MRTTRSLAPIAVGLGLALCAPAVLAQVVVDLPALAGGYEAGMSQPPTYPGSRLTTFRLPADLIAVESLRLVVSGSWNEGLIACNNPYGGEPDTMAFQPGLSLYLHLPNETYPRHHFHATVQPAGGAFSGLAATFVSSYPPGSPNLLLGTDIEAEFFVDFVLILPCNIVAAAWGEVTSVRVEVTGTVPVEDRSWGAVRALYR